MGVLLMRRMTISPEDAERLVAYFVVLAIAPVADTTTASKRITLANRVIAGQRLGRETLTALTEADEARKELVQDIMFNDEKIARWTA